MANYSDLYAVLRCIKKPKLIDGGFSVKLDNGEYRELSIDSTCENCFKWNEEEKTLTIIGYGRWYFGSEALLKIDGVESIIEYNEGENGCNYFCYWEDGEEVEDIYMCKEMVKAYGAEFALDNYQSCLSEEEVEELLSIIKEVDEEFYNELDLNEVKTDLLLEVGEVA